MNAKECLEKEEIDFIKAIGLDMWRDEKVYFVSEVIEFMESYHLAKSKEEAQEKYERANKLITEANSDDNIISVIPFNKALRIAAGIEGKEEEK